jgi:hypothetical protein
MALHDDGTYTLVEIIVQFWQRALSNTELCPVLNAKYIGEQLRYCVPTNPEELSLSIVN